MGNERSGKRRSVDARGPAPGEVARVRDDQAELGVQLIPIARGDWEGEGGDVLDHLDPGRRRDDQAEPAGEPAFEILIRQAVRQREAGGHHVAAEQFGAIGIEDDIRRIRAVRKFQRDKSTTSVQVDPDPQTMTAFVDNFANSGKHDASPPMACS